MAEKSVYVILAIFIAVVILVFSFFILGTGISGVESIYNWILSVLGIFKRSEFEEAIMCSYYRCTEGCQSTKISNLLHGKCADDFCDKVPSELKPNNKVCGINAAQYPVILEGFSSDKIFDAKDFEPKFDCVYTEKSIIGSDFNPWFLFAVVEYSPGVGFPPQSILAGGFGLAKILIDHFASFNHLIIKDQLIKSRDPPQGGVCKITYLWMTGDMSIHNGFSKFSLKSTSEPIYVMTTVEGMLSNRFITAVDNIPYYEIIEKDEPKEVIFLNFLYTQGWKRINIAEKKDLNFIFRTIIKGKLPDCNTTIYLDGKMAETTDDLTMEEFKNNGDTATFTFRGHKFEFTLQDHSECEVIELIIPHLHGGAGSIKLCDCKQVFANFTVVYKGQQSSV